MGRIRHIHFVGIGGVGMAGIAEVLLSEGYCISGSDLAENALTKRLHLAGARIYYGHAASHVEGADVVVRSSAVLPDNPELLAAHAAHIPVVQRAEMLGELMRFRYGIAIAGTHGKTTTTSLVTAILAEASEDPTFVIGGQLNSTGTHARLGTGKYLVAEADESDASFLHLKPMISVITNIDADHLSAYHNDFSELRAAFLEFIRRLPFYGLAVICLDDPVIRELLHEMPRPFTGYGFSATDAWQAYDLVQKGMCSHFTVKRPGHFTPLSVTLNLPGRHNVLNALAAIAVATELKIPDAAIQQALEKFSGIGRRFQIHGDFPLAAGGRVTLMEDYGHHPREIAATLQAARQSWPDRRLVMVYQPHRYTRTRDLFAAFCDVLSQVDQLLLLEIYSAGEAPVPGISSAALAECMQAKGFPVQCVPLPDHLPQVLQEVLQSGDVVLMQGAGSIGSMAGHLAATRLQEAIPVSSADVRQETDVCS